MVELANAINQTNWQTAETTGNIIADTVFVAQQQGLINKKDFPEIQTITGTLKEAAAIGNFFAFLWTSKLFIVLTKCILFLFSFLGNDEQAIKAAEIIIYRTSQVSRNLTTNGSQIRENAGDSNPDDLLHSQLLDNISKAAAKMKSVAQTGFKFFLQRLK